MAQPVPVSARCSNPACEIADSGKCLEGLTPGECPHFGNAAEGASSDDEAPTEDPPADSPELSLRPAVALTAGEAGRLLAAQRSRVLAFIGPAGCGKSSLIGGFYELFQLGSVGSLRFGRSETLHGYEQLCHDARGASERGEPVTERTKGEQADYYHMELRDLPGTDPRSLLFADRAGERYDHIAVSRAEAARFEEIQRADTITIVVDGVGLVDRVERHNTKDHARMLAQGLADGGIETSSKSLAIVMTKLDIVCDSDREETTRSDFEGLVGQITRAHSPRFRAIRSFETAASPSRTSADRGAGLRDLLVYYWDTTSVLADPVDYLQPARPARAIDRLRVVQ